MKVRALDSDLDWTFGKGRQNYKSAMNALKQNISCRLKQWVGDCFFALTDGVDWNNYLDIGQKELLDLNIKKVILGTIGVLSMSSYESTLDIDTRGLSVTVNLSTIFGQTIYEEFVVWTPPSTDFSDFLIDLATGHISTTSSDTYVGPTFTLDASGHLILSVSDEYSGPTAGNADSYTLEDDGHLEVTI